MSLPDLLFALTFILPTGMAVPIIKQAGGGLLRYLLAVPVALLLGAFLVWVSWNSTRWLWARAEQKSNRMQNVIVLATFCLELLLLVVAGISGVKLASLLIRLIV